MKKIVFNSLLTGMAMLMSIGSNAQIKTPQPSPIATITQAVGLGEVAITYSRPSKKGRVIFGGLEAFDEIWRTGANASTKIKFSDDVTLEGNKVPKGEYALYTIPGKEEWTIIIHKNITHWGTGDKETPYKAEEDLVRFKVKALKTPATVETFTINIADITMNSAFIELMWDNTLVRFKMETDIDSKIMASIESTLNPKPSASPYYQAASYYYESGKDLNQALIYVNKALELRKTFWMIHLKAKIQSKMNDYNGAIETAMLSIEQAKIEANDDYIKLNEKLIAECNAKKKSKS